MKYPRLFSNFGAKIQICLKVKVSQNCIFEQKLDFWNCVHSTYGYIFVLFSLQLRLQNFFSCILKVCLDFLCSVSSSVLGILCFSIPLNTLLFFSYKTETRESYSKETFFTKLTISSNYKIQIWSKRRNLFHQDF